MTAFGLFRPTPVYESQAKKDYSSRFSRSADQSLSSEIIATPVTPRSFAYALMMSRWMSVAFDALCFRYAIHSEPLSPSRASAFGSHSSSWRWFSANPAGYHKP